MRLFTMATAVIVILAAASPAEAKRHHYQKGIDANGNIASPCVVHSHKTAAKATVGCSHVAAFQAYIDDLENNHGSIVRFMGGVRRGKCWSGGLHPCGKALDVCQLSRGRVDARCHLPGKSQLAAIASRHGLFEGGQWCHSDYGHAQVGVSAAACGSGTTMAARSYRHRRHYRNNIDLPQTMEIADRWTAH